MGRRSDADDLDRGKVAPFAVKHGIPYPILYGEEEVGQDFGGIIGYPTLFVVDREGRIVKRFIGYTDERNIELVVQPLL